MSLLDIFELGMDRSIPKARDDLDPSTNVVLNVGCGNKKIVDAHNIDYPEWDAELDLLPYGDNIVDQIHAYHFLEHVHKPVEMLLEFQRVLRPGGFVNIVVPYYNSQMQFQDLDHKHIFCEETWRVLFDNPYYNKNAIEWKFDVGVNVIMGVAERNLALITQLIKREA